jgi:hypothetical protein
LRICFELAISWEFLGLRGRLRGESVGFYDGGMKIVQTVMVCNGFEWDSDKKVLTGYEENVK